MPPRDEQDFEEKRQQIIDGALTAFSSKGFDKASNKDIADAAKIRSPGLIYHYFKDKFDLLISVVQERMPVLRVFDIADDLMQLPIEQALHELISKLLLLLEEKSVVDIAKIIVSESIRTPRVLQMVSDIGPGRGLRKLAVYFEQQMEAGNLRPMNPHIAARLLIGPCLAYAITRHFFQLPESRQIPPEEMAKQIVETFLRGMRPDPS